MKAMACFQYGPPEVLELSEMSMPILKNNEILVRIFATSVNSADIRLRKADPWAVRLFFGLNKPRIPVLGGAFSGEVEAIGSAVTRYKVGDPVFGSTGLRFGAYAGYTALPEDAVIAIKPSNINHLEAATISFGALTALHFLKKAAIAPGQHILIYGASGAIGTAAVQLARHFGARVTAVCSTSNMAMVRSLGADRVIDYTTDDFREREDRYDVVYETVNKLPFGHCLDALKKGGTLILGAAMMRNIINAAWCSLTSRYRIISGVAKENLLGMQLLAELIEEGKYRPVVDRTYTLEQLVEAHRYVEKGHKKGNVAISI